VVTEFKHLNWTLKPKRGSYKIDPHIKRGENIVKENQMYYDVKKALSYSNKLFYFIIGARNLGKSYSSKHYCVTKFLKQKRKFIYLRRYKTELKDNDKFFKDIANDPDFKNLEFKVKGSKFYINDELAGYSVNLSTQQVRKSTAYPDVDTIMFDEFIIEEGVYRYLNNEVKQFLAFYQTVDRSQDRVKVLFLANAITFFNPYFIYYDLPKPKSKNGIYTKREGIYLEVVNEINYEVINQTKKTVFMRMNEGTEYYEHAVNNVFILDDDKFIVNKFPSTLENTFNITSNGKTFGIWVDYREGKMYVRTKHDPTRPNYTTFNDHTPNTLIFKVNKSILLKKFKDSFLEGLVYFDSQKTYTEMYKTIKKLI